MTLDQALVARMKERKLEKQSQAAPVLGVPQPQLSKWLRLVDVPGDQYVPVIAEFLDIPHDEAILLLARTRAVRLDAAALRARVVELEEQVARLKDELQ